MITFAAAAALALIAVTDASAQQSEFTAADGLWNDAANWSAGIPDSTTQAFVNNGGIARIAADAEASYVRVGDANENPSGITGTGTLIVSANFVAQGNISIGDDPGTTGTYEQSGGAVSVVAGGGDFEIGDPGAVGFFTLTGGSIDVIDNFELAEDGDGTSMATGTMTDGSISADGLFTIGGNGTASFTMSGGSISSVDDLQIGDSATGVGTFDFSGGTASTDDNYQIGQVGNGTVNQTGGDVTAGGNVAMAINAAATGSYDLSAGTITSDNNSYIARGGVATFTQSGGTHSVTTDVFISENDGSSATYDLSGGSLLVGRNVYIGNNSGSEGSLSISGGTFDVDGFVSVGGSVNFAGDDVTGNVGSFTVNGSDADITVGNGFFADGTDSLLVFNVDDGGISVIDVSGFDALIANADVDLGILSGADVLNGDVFDLLTAPDIDGVPTLLGEDLDNWELSIVSGGNGQILQAAYVAVPEPTSLAAVGLAGLLLARRKRVRA